MGVVFTKLSDTRVKVVDEKGNVYGFASQNVNVLEIPFEEAIVITSKCNPITATSGLNDGLFVKVSDVTTPAVSSKRELIEELITNYFV